MFKALLLTEKDGKVTPQITQLDEERLPEGDVTVRVQYSTLNYKDGLILNGLGRLVRNYPHVPGVDFAGVVEASQHPRFRVNDNVILTGWRVGEMQWGGYAERARVRGDWLVKLPADLTARNAMAIGTAGFTAMLSVMALEQHALTPASGDVLVTGAAGGGGSVAVAVLKKLGYRLVAATARAATPAYPKGVGAAGDMRRARDGRWGGGGRGRRGRRRGGRHSQDARLSRGRPDRARGHPRLPEGAGRRGDHRPCHHRAAVGQAAGQRALGRLHRFRRRRDPRGGAAADEIPRQRRGLRPRRRQQAGDHGHPLHHPRREAARHRFRRQPAGRALGSLDPSRPRSATGQAGKDDRARQARGSACAGEADPRRQDPRARGC